MTVRRDEPDPITAKFAKTHRLFDSSEGSVTRLTRQELAEIKAALAAALRRTHTDTAATEEKR